MIFFLLFFHLIFIFSHFIHVYLRFFDFINELVEFLSFLNRFFLPHITFGNQIIVLRLNLKIVQIYLFFYSLIALVQDLKVIEDILLLIPQLLLYFFLIYFLFFWTLWIFPYRIVPSMLTLTKIWFHILFNIVIIVYRFQLLYSFTVFSIWPYIFQSVGNLF